MDGYKVVDLGGTSITTTPATITGVYNAIHISDKVILLVGLVINGDAYLPSYAACLEDGSGIHAYVAGQEILITDEDSVSLVVPTP